MRTKQRRLRFIILALSGVFLAGADKAHCQGAEAQRCPHGVGMEMCDYDSPSPTNTTTTVPPVFVYESSRSSWNGQMHPVTRQAAMIEGSHRAGLMTADRAATALAKLQAGLEKQEARRASWRRFFHGLQADNYADIKAFSKVLAFVLGAGALFWLAIVLSDARTTAEKARSRARDGLREAWEGTTEVDTLKGTVLVMASCSYCGTGDLSGAKCRCCGAPNPNPKGTVSNPGEEKSRPSSGWNRPVPVG